MNLQKNMIYLEDKLTEFRIAGQHPSYVGLSEEFHDTLTAEMKQENRVHEFFGVPVITMGGSIMPKDGVYIHPMTWSRSEV